MQVNSGERFVVTMTVDGMTISIEKSTFPAPSNIRFDGDAIMNTGGDTNIISNSSNINIKSKLTNVSQRVGSISNADDSQKNELKTLLTQLTEHLQSLPKEKTDEAEAIANQAGLIVDEASKPSPNKSTLNILGNGLKQAVQFVKDAAPATLAIADKIVGLINSIFGT